MTTEEYLSDVLTTEARDWQPLQERFSSITNIRLLHGIIGLASELSEMQDVVDNAEEHLVVDKVNLLEEAGDFYWYIGVITAALNLDKERTLGPTKGTLPGVAPDRRLGLTMLQRYATRLTINVGELTDVAKKSVMYGRELNTGTVTDYLEHVNYWLRSALSLYGYTGEDAQYTNSQKLLRGKDARYKNGFSEQAALNRNLEAERNILENKE